MKEYWISATREESARQYFLVRSSIELESHFIEDLFQELLLDANLGRREGDGSGCDFEITYANGTIHKGYVTFDFRREKYDSDEWDVWKIEKELSGIETGDGDKPGQKWIEWEELPLEERSHYSDGAKVEIV